jgi:hypothetical protein
MRAVSRYDDVPRQEGRRTIAGRAVVVLVVEVGGFNSDNFDLDGRQEAAHKSHMASIITSRHRCTDSYMQAALGRT